MADEKAGRGIKPAADFPQQLTWKAAFLFPVETPESRQDVFLGGVLLIFLLPFGWILNLGNRLEVVRRLYCGNHPYFRGFRPLGYTFRRGCISAAAIAAYLAPSFVLLAAAGLKWIPGSASLGTAALALLGAAAFVLAVFTLPGCMTVFAVEGDARVLRQPHIAFQRAWTHRRMYGKAWAMALVSIVLSFLGLAGLLIGFFFTSVWAWEVVGYAFTVAMYSERAEDR